MRTHHANGKEEMIVEVVAGLAVRSESVLLAQRHESEVTEWSGAWCLAGGKVEVGESQEAALSREWREELDGSIKVGPLLHSMLHRTTGYPYPYRVTTFAVTITTEPKLLHAGGQDLRWVQLPTLKGLRLLPGTMPSILAYNALYDCGWEIE